MDPGYAGRAFDEEMLASLPSGVDPCGENGEFHTFVHDGPPFRFAIPYTIGEIVLREERFSFCDLIPKA
jgi:diphthamide synthase (EF-2-diphthine--ammonia ligase)